MLFDKELFKGMLNFAGWNFIGSSAVVLRSQGANLLLNAFGGPAVNAANGIANTITGVVSTFVNNFTQAYIPQITKRYATREYKSLMTLLIYGSKYSYYLMFFLGLPVILNAHFIFRIWLGMVPEYTVVFSRWIFVYLLADSVSRPIITAKNATGRIRNYQIVVGGVLLLMLPISYVCLKIGFPVVVVAISNAMTAILAIFARMVMLRGDFPCWSSKIYFSKVILNVIMVSIVASILPLFVFTQLEEGWFCLFSTTTLSIFCTLFSILYIGCERVERKILISKSHEIIKNIRKRL